jgi:hypothetical protein
MDSSWIGIKFLLVPYLFSLIIRVAKEGIKWLPIISNNNQIRRSDVITNYISGITVRCSCYMKIIFGRLLEFCKKEL